jgi:hypothetical protein
MSLSQCPNELPIHFDTDNMPAGRTVINIESSDAQRRERLYWLIVNDGNVDVCVKYSGFDSDIKFFSIIRAMAEVWRGIGSLRDEIAIGSIVLEGNLKLRKEFPGRLLLSHFAPIKSMRRVEILIG